MRWEALFDDLEAQLDAATQADLRAQVAELTRAERASVVLADRIRASRGAALRVRLAEGGGVEAGVVVDAAAHWFLLAPAADRRVLVPIGAVVAVAGLSPAVAPPAGVVERRLTLGHALRALALDRVEVTVVADGLEVTGRLEAVGADHVDLTPATGERPASLTIAFAALRAVRSR